ncbi:MAG: hypothetical protein FDZ70_02690 [Actinobacteria bacterium]|nr:MAG: hypothetical protein FDZ70_02690 [Actinomycetota bacterium]
MQAADVLLAVLMLAATAAACVAVYAMLRAARAMDEMRAFTKRLDERLMPLLDKADVSLDAFNAELLRVDEIVTQVEDATDRVSSTARVAQEAVGAPMRVLAGAGEGLARIFSRAGRRRETEYARPAADVRRDDE